MKMKLTNQEVLNLFNVLSNLNVPGNGKFTYTIAKNRSLLKAHVEVIQETANAYGKSHPELRSYQTKVDQLLRDFAVDKDGKPLVRQSPDGSSLSRIIPPEKQSAYVEARTALDAEYRAVLTGLQLSQEEFARTLQEEIEVELRPLSIKDLPEGALNTQVMNLIFVFVEEDMGEVRQLPPLREVPS